MIRDMLCIGIFGKVLCVLTTIETFSVNTRSVFAFRVRCRLLRYYYNSRFCGGIKCGQRRVADLHCWVSVVIVALVGDSCLRVCCDKITNFFCHFSFVVVVKSHRTCCFFTHTTTLWSSLLLLVRDCDNFLLTFLAKNMS